MSLPHRMHILGELSVEDFLANYWQKKPVVIRGAFPDFEMPFSAEELAGLALDTDAPTRIISENGFKTDDKPWQVKHSPLTEEDFTSTPESHWTFLVNDLERYIPELGNLIEPFRFIPDWRIDDLMVSYAADKGSVGPHTDEYDVFLIQGEGRRRWKIDSNNSSSKILFEDTELAILSDFNTDQEYLLEAGDMLYLPPNMPHYGIAEGECITFSVGFRAPRTLDLVQNWLESFAENTANNPELQKRYSDTDRKPQQSSAEISIEDIQKLSGDILSAVDNQKDKLKIFLGKYLTEQRGEIKNAKLEEPVTGYLKGQDYERASWLRLAYIEDNENIHLFADGEHLELGLDKKELVREFCEDYYYADGFLGELLETKEMQELFNQLILPGGVYQYGQN